MRSCSMVNEYKCIKTPTSFKKLTQKNSVKTQTPRKESVASTLPELSDSEAVVPQRRKGRPTASGTGAAHTAHIDRECAAAAGPRNEGSWRRGRSVLSASSDGGRGRVTRAVGEFGIVAQQCVATREDASIKRGDTLNKAIAGERGGV